MSSAMHVVSDKKVSSKPKRVQKKVEKNKSKINRLPVSNPFLYFASNRKYKHIIDKHSSLVEKHQTFVKTLNEPRVGDIVVVDEKGDDSGFNRDLDQKSEMEKSMLNLSLSKSLSMNLLGNREFIIATGSRTSVATNGASAMIFGLPTGSILSCSLSSTIIPEISALITLFDEVKVAGIHCRYNPVNPYNRGAVTVSIPIAIFFDDVDSGLSPTNSNAGMGAASNRGPHNYYSFSPDHTFDRTFMRPTNLNFYDWTPVTNLGSEPSTLGGLYVVGDGGNTASINYGYMEFWFLLHFRVRQ